MCSFDSDASLVYSCMQIRYVTVCDAVRTQVRDWDWCLRCV